ncbi:Cdc6/Cdc18 family protein [Halalkaliarchaeum desulfuricum]|uniref:hypothetical protein n=1 Tax=Halalkaliarchaeum desulfuricum TaxID=2055893 RepID=UPI000E6CB3EB|nr:hypothetical protein [Halalkaliarchaeum desulfuricum]
MRKRPSIKHRCLKGETTLLPSARSCDLEQHILRALALLTEETGRTRFRTAEVYDAYENVVSQTNTSPLSYDRVQRLLKEQAFLGITESEYTGGGHGEGSYRVHRLLRSPEVVVEALDRE